MPKHETRRGRTAAFEARFAAERAKKAKQAKALGLTEPTPPQLNPPQEGKP